MKGITPHNTQTVVVKMKVMTNEAHTYNMNFKEKLHNGLECRDGSLLDKGMRSGQRWKSYQLILHQSFVYYQGMLRVVLGLWGGRIEYTNAITKEGRVHVEYQSFLITFDVLTNE